MGRSVAYSQTMAPNNLKVGSAAMPTLNKPFNPNSTLSTFHKNHDLQPANPSGKDMAQVQAVTGSTSELSTMSDSRMLNKHIRNK